MQIDRDKYRKLALANPNGYCDIDVPEVVASTGETWLRVVCIHHLTPAENGNNHHVYVDILDEQGSFIDRPDRMGFKLRYSWKGRKESEAVEPAPFEKTGNEPRGNVPIWKNAEFEIYIAGDLPSASVHGLRTNLGGEGGGNEQHHNSYYVIFQIVRQAVPVTQPLILPVGEASDYYVPAANVVDAMGKLRATSRAYERSILDVYPEHSVLIGLIFDQLDVFSEQVQSAFVK